VKDATRRHGGWRTRFGSLALVLAFLAEGQNLAIGYRWAEGKPERMRELAEELVRLKVDIIMAPSSVDTGAVTRATSTIPIIFLSHADPLGSGHVKSLARPDRA
jgi:putative ABC transport system substrate-binding protein